MKQIIPNRLAEIIFALAMGVFALLHFKSGNDTQFRASVPAYFPGDASIWIYISGAGFLLVAIAILINRQKRLACYLLAVMLIVFILTIHLIPAIRDKNLYQPLKDGALAMAAIIIGNNASK